MSLNGSIVMANLGKCLLFYLKYPTEMERLYETEEPDEKGLPDADQVLEKIRLVGNAASAEAAELLETCAPGIEEHFRGISVFRRSPNNLENTWDLQFTVSPTKARERRFFIGVSIDPKRRALIPWVWCRNAGVAEDEIVRILGRGMKSKTLGWNLGAVGLTEIKIPMPEKLEEFVVCDTAVSEVEQAFKCFTGQEVKELAALVKS
jgi:hypothetical protein